MKPINLVGTRIIDLQGGKCLHINSDTNVVGLCDIYGMDMTDNIPVGEIVLDGEELKYQTGVTKVERRGIHRHGCDMGQLYNNLVHKFKNDFYIYSSGLYAAIIDPKNGITVLTAQCGIVEPIGVMNGFVVLANAAPTKSIKYSLFDPKNNTLNELITTEPLIRFKEGYHEHRAIVFNSNTLYHDAIKAGLKVNFENFTAEVIDLTKLHPLSGLFDREDIDVSVCSRHKASDEPYTVLGKRENERETYFENPSLESTLIVMSPLRRFAKTDAEITLGVEFTVIDPATLKPIIGGIFGDNYIRHTQSLGIKEVRTPQNFQFKLYNLGEHCLLGENNETELLAWRGGGASRVYNYTKKDDGRIEVQEDYVSTDFCENELKRTDASFYLSFVQKEGERRADKGRDNRPPSDAKLNAYYFENNKKFPMYMLITTVLPNGVERYYDQLQLLRNYQDNIAVYRSSIWYNDLYLTGDKNSLKFEDVYEVQTGIKEDKFEIIDGKVGKLLGTTASDRFLIHKTYDWPSSSHNYADPLTYHIIDPSGSNPKPLFDWHSSKGNLRRQYTTFLSDGQEYYIFAFNLGLKYGAILENGEVIAPPKYTTDTNALKTGLREAMRNPAAIKRLLNKGNEIDTQIEGDFVENDELDFLEERL